MPSTVVCNVCCHEMRNCVYMRHCSKHKKDMHSICDQSRIDYLLENKLPILSPTDNSWIVCLICQKGAFSKQSISEFNKSYKILHKKCMLQFDSVKHFYDVTAPKPKKVKDEPTAATEPVNTIVYDSKVDDLEKSIAEKDARIKELEAKLLEAQATPPACEIDPDPESKYNVLLEKFNDLQTDFEDIHDCYISHKGYKRICENMTDVIDRLISNNKDKATLQCAVDLQTEFDNM